MSDGVLFWLSSVVMVIVITVATFLIKKYPPSQWISYFTNTNDGLGILKGIAVVLALAGLFVLIFGSKAHAEEGRWFDHASIYAGLDYTKKLSPMCEQGGIDDHWTSNVGLKVNLYQTKSENFSANFKYTHHSCMLGIDDRSYDAFGIMTEWRFWNR